MFETMIAAGLLSAIGAFFLLLRLGTRFMAKNAFWIDFVFTFGLIMMFWGTFSGMLAAALGGAVLSVALWLVRGFHKWRSKRAA